MEPAPPLPLRSDALGERPLYLADTPNGLRAGPSAIRTSLTILQDRLARASPSCGSGERV